MSDVKAQFSMLNQTADPAVADAIRLAVEQGQDHELNRINVLDFAKRSGLDEELVISGFLHASRLGLSRVEYIRRRLASDAATSDGAVSAQDLRSFASLASDLDDPQVMGAEWQ